MPKTQTESKSARTRPRRPATANPALSPRSDSTASRADQNTQHRRLLTAVAYHSGIGEPDCCLAALAMLSASRALRRALDRDLGNQEKSEFGFLALVTLYAVEPIACTPEALAHDAEVRLGAMLDVLDFLEQRGWVAREYPGPQGRSSRVHLTEAGIQTTVLAVHRFLEISATLAGDLGADQRRAATKACAQIVRAAALAQNERSKSELHS